MGVSPISGAICGVTRVMLGYVRHANISAIEYETVAPGIPICDVARWPDAASVRNVPYGGCIDQAMRVRAFLTGDRLTVTWTNASTLPIAYRVGRVAFGADEVGRLVSLEVYDLSDVERSFLP